jgi:hypothetical protein
VDKISQPRFETKRFHIKYGPESLFERVLFKMKGNRKLNLHADHFLERTNQRKIESDIFESLNEFNSNQWALVTAEVRKNSGKFVNSTWSKRFNQGNVWITIGFNDTVQTVILKESDGLGFEYESFGEFYDFVEKVNYDLMSKEP